MRSQALLTLVVSLLLVSLCLMALGSAAAEPMTALTKNHPLIELPTTAAPPDLQLHMTARFKVRNETEWDRLTKEHADPSSSEFHHEWTSEEIHRRFGALPADFHMVEQWLLSNGFTITLERYGRGSSDSIMFTGTAAQAEKAFGVKIVKSRDAFANTSDPIVPAQIAAVLDRIDGLDNTQPPPVPQSFRAPPRALSPGVLPPVSDYFGDTLAIPQITSSLVPSDLYSIYNELPLNNAGITGSANTCPCRLFDARTGSV